MDETNGFFNTDTNELILPWYFTPERCRRWLEHWGDKLPLAQRQRYQDISRGIDPFGQNRTLKWQPRPEQYGGPYKKGK